MGTPRLFTVLAAVGAGILLAGYAVTMAGCSVTVGVTEEFKLDEPLGSAAVTDVEIEMGSGTLSIKPGAVGLVSGTIRYNVESWKPKVSRTERKISIEQGSRKGLSGFEHNLVNDWDLQLGKAPMRLRVSAEAYEGLYDLSGLTLQELRIKDGAGRAQVMFNAPNPGRMEILKYETGASTVSLIGLANANFGAMDFEGGAGTYSLDFSGELRTDATVDIEAGAGTMRITVPASTPAEVTVSGSLNSISTEGAWTVSGHIYSTAAAGTVGQGKMLTIRLEMDVGSVTLAAM